MLYIVTPPSTKTNSRSPAERRSQHDDLGREVGRGGGAGAYELPEREFEVAVLARRVVVPRVGLLEIGQGESVAGVAHHQEQQGPQLFRAERRPAPKLPLAFREWLVFEFVAQAPQQVRLDEHLRPGLPIEVEDFPDRHADRKPGSDDPAGPGSGDIVEVIGKAKIRAAALGLEEIFDPLQHL